MTTRSEPRRETLHLNRGELDAESVEVCAFCLGDWPCQPAEHQAAIEAADTKRRHDTRKKAVR